MGDAKKIEVSVGISYEKVYIDGHTCYDGNDGYRAGAVISFPLPVSPDSPTFCSMEFPGKFLKDLMSFSSHIQNSRSGKSKLEFAKSSKSRRSMSSNNGANSSRRTFSSPYLASLNNRTSKSQYRPRAGASNNPGQSSRSRFSSTSNPAPPRGSRSAPPNFSTAHPELHEFFKRRSELHKEVHRTLLQSKLDRLLDYQEQLEKEISELERGCGDAGIFASSYRAQNPKPKPATSSTSKSKLKQFRVLGGCPGNLSYKIHRKPDKDGKIRSFSLEVDVKGFKPENLEVESEDTIMTIKASKLNGTRKDLKVVAPSTKDMDKAYINHPKLGVLVIDF